MLVHILLHNLTCLQIGIRIWEHVFETGIPLKQEDIIPYRKILDTDATLRYPDSRQEQKDAPDIMSAAGPLLYGAGIDDSILLKNETRRST
ncbi:hypothetical protein NQ318_012013 [Aromia moschata]|uniref:Uncharacterized protein n=1 Tax=Aromia moschata TaxID=1265417 RepID=A0AAV8YFL7_9CUCU|nr:hypothetical protein NQ318_012013 [Aromia moschata]